MSDDAMRRRLRILSKPKDWRSEDEFRKHVTAFAECLGYRVNFTYRAKTRDGSWRTNATAPGYPDLTCSKVGRLVFLELKMPGNQPTDLQQEWIARLQTIEGVDAFVVWPRDWPDIVSVLVGDDESDDDDPFDL